MGSIRGLVLREGIEDCGCNIDMHTTKCIDIMGGKDGYDD